MIDQFQMIRYLSADFVCQCLIPGQFHDEIQPVILKKGGVVCRCFDSMIQSELNTGCIGIDVCDPLDGNSVILKFRTHQQLQEIDTEPSGANNCDICV